MVVLGKEVRELGSNPKVEDLVIGERYLIDDLIKVENREFYLDEAVLEYEDSSTGCSTGVLRYIGDGGSTPEDIVYNGKFMFMNTFGGDFCDD